MLSETIEERKFARTCLEESLLSEYGPIVGGAELMKLLGYRSGQAFRQAQNRGTLPIAVFKIPHRRGKFAFTSDIALWLHNLREGGDSHELT